MNALPPFSDPGWTLLEGATVSAAAARTNAVGLVFGAVGNPFPDPSVSQGAERVIDVLPGVERPLSVWLRAESGIGNAVVMIEDPAGSENWVELAYLPAAPGDGWTELTAPYTPASSSIRVRLYAVTGPGFTVDWSADDPFFDDLIPVEVAAMQRGMRLAWLAFRDRLLTIRREAGYYHDLTIVLPRLATPSKTAIRDAYVCLPVEDTGGYGPNDTGELEITFRQPVYVFPAVSDSDDFEVSGGADAANWHDDLLRAVWSEDETDTWDLGSGTRIVAIRPVSKSIQSEPFEDFPPHVRVVFEGTVCVTRPELGPQGA